MRILLVSQLYPGRDDPDLGTFVRQVELSLRERDHDVELAVLDRRAGGRRRWATLARRARTGARRFRPDVVYAHFLVPTGLIGLLAAPRVPLVVTAHGQDVANVVRIPGIRAATRAVARRAATVVAVSRFLRERLERTVPEARGKVEVVDSGVDTDRFRLLPAAPAPAGHAFVCVGSLSERKNVLRLAAAFERLGSGTLTFVGDGPLRAGLEGRRGITVTGALPQAELPARLAAAGVVCGPSLVEPFGQALLEAMACGRSVVATRIGGPPEFVPRSAGVLVDPYDEDELVAALAEAARLPCPNPSARLAALAHDVRVQAARIEAILTRAAAG